MKITQKQIAFYILYKKFKLKPDVYLPTWEFMGEVEINGKWYMASYKCPTRLTDIFQENPGLLERKVVIGKSGSSYYGYRFSSKVSPELIKDSTLSDFYLKIRYFKK